jgi:hypothetical protein
MRKSSRFTVALSMALLTAVWASSMASASPSDGEKRQGGGHDGIVNTAREVYYQQGDGASALQHGTLEDHLPPGNRNVTRISKTRLTNIPGRVADVTYINGFAYLNAWSAGLPENECTGGVWAVDIRNPREPVVTAFRSAAKGSYYTEGAHALHIDTPAFQGNILLESVEACGATAPGTGGGLDIWDITNPASPVLLSRGFGDYAVGDVGTAPDTIRPHQAHSTFGWADGDAAYAAMIDNEELLDLDLADISDPANPVMVSETGDSEWPETTNAYGDFPTSHDFVAKKIDGTWHLMVSYWDAGWVDLNVDDPANPTFIGDTDYAECDQVVGPPACPPEGNAHQNEWNRNSNLFVGTDEDFSAFRLNFEVTTGPHAGAYDAGEFSWTVPIVDLPERQLNGPMIFGGYGCPDDRAGIPTAEESIAAHGITLGENEELILVLQRGPVSDPNDTSDACFFSEKVETAQLLGYDAAVVANHHVGSGAGAQPDAFLCGSQGHEFDVQIPGLCFGHRLMHLAFDDPTNANQTYDPPDYSVPYPVGDPGDVEPDVGDLGWSLAATAEYDGWGYARLHNANTLQELDQYAIDEAVDVDFAQGYGDLTVHEVAMERNKELANLAYFAWYSGGFRVASFNGDGIRQRGFYIDSKGNNFWGVELCGFHRGERVICASDRDYGLFLFKYTGDN